MGTGATCADKCITSANGRNGKITGFVLSRNGTAVANRKVFVQSLTPLKGDQ